MRTLLALSVILIFACSNHDDSKSQAQSFLEIHFIYLKYKPI